jgi:hypothetical protein
LGKKFKRIDGQGEPFDTFGINVKVDIERLVEFDAAEVIAKALEQAGNEMLDAWTEASTLIEPVEAGE